jgi:hypothetical protein
MVERTIDIAEFKWPRPRAVGMFMLLIISDEQEYLNRRNRHPRLMAMKFSSINYEHF